MAYFDIYKASAGAGKTYRLVLKYILLLFKDKYFNDYHRRILAVTFTNKATGEMKRRIIESLYEMAQQRSAYIAEIRKEYPEQYKTDDSVRDKALLLLTNILDNYSNFNVKTIDSFFQQILRNFAHEINYYSNFKVELDKNMIIERVVDDLINTLSEDSPLYEYIKKFALMRVNDGLSFNIKQSLFDMVQNLFNEAFIKQSDLLPSIFEFKSVVEMVERKEKGVLAEIEAVCNVVQSVMEGNGLTIDDFSRKGSNPVSYFNFEKLKKGSSGKSFVASDGFYKMLYSEEISTYATSKSGRLSEISAFVVETMEVRHGFARVLERYHTISAMKKYLYIVAILNDIKERINEKTKEDNSILISSSTEFINSIIDNSDAPFIYEKTGVFVDNFMIDEFQDTSLLQWENFKPLLQQSVANGNWNMVVGDVKQSIYRWREGDWSILNKKVEAEFDNSVCTMLKENYRSYRNVVETNNKLLPEVVGRVGAFLLDNNYVGVREEEREDMIKANFVSLYADLRQEVVKDNAGSYNMRFHKVESDDKEWREKMLEVMLEDIRCLRDKGYKYSDISVLVRYNREANMVAEALMVNDIPVVSNEALLVNNSHVVQFLIALLKYVSNIHNVNYRFNLLYSYAMTVEDKWDLFANLEEVINRTDFNDKEWEKEVFGEEVAVQLREIKNYNIHEFIVASLSLFDIVNKDTQYTQALLDVVYDFNSMGVGDTMQFLEYWEKKSDSLKLSMSTDRDAVNIYTIHKSKGMQYDVVMLPFCDWELGPSTKKNNYVWVETKEVDDEVSEVLPIVPIDLGKGYSAALRTKFADKAREEYEKCCVDQLNIAYVAFTRAVKHMYVYCKLDMDKNGEVKEDNNLSYLMYDVYDRGVLVANKIEAEDYIKYTVGELQENETLQEGTEIDETVEIEMKSNKHIRVEDFLRLRSLESSTASMNEGLVYGKFMHRVFENIKYHADIEDSIEMLCKTEAISKENKERIRDLVYGFVDYNEEVSSWYTEKYRILNETEILLPNDEIYRPDRVVINKENGDVVVIDYKFGKVRKKYEQQVGRYLKILNSMGYLRVEGKICYISEAQISIINIVVR